MLKALHELCDEGKPMDFLCDMPALFGVQPGDHTDLGATEVKGRKYNYDYKLTLKEFVSPNKGLMDKSGEENNSGCRDQADQEDSHRPGGHRWRRRLSSSYAAAKAVDNAPQAEPAMVVSSGLIGRA
jgi:hypothetical protein